jgi:hypothetical protein
MEGARESSSSHLSIFAYTTAGAVMTARAKTGHHRLPLPLSDLHFPILVSRFSIHSSTPRGLLALQDRRAAKIEAVAPLEFEYILRIAN